MGNLVVLFQKLVLLPLNVIEPIIVLAALLNRAVRAVDKVATNELEQWESQIKADADARKDLNKKLEEAAKELANTRASNRVEQKKLAKTITADSIK